MGRPNYHEYLRSPEWHVVRRLAIERADGRCQVCNQPGSLNVHHRTYARLGEELLSDVTVLCRDCHAKHHDKLPTLPATVADLPLGDEREATVQPIPLTPAESALQQRIANETFGLSPTVQTYREAA